MHFSLALHIVSHKSTNIIVGFCCNFPSTLYSSSIFYPGSSTLCALPFLSHHFLYQFSIINISRLPLALLLLHVCRGPFTLQTGLNVHSNRFASMHIRTGSIRFGVFTLLQTHKCEVIFVTWPLRQHRMTITVWTVPAKMGILSKIVQFRVTLSSWPWTFSWPCVLTRALWALIDFIVVQKYK